MEEAPENGKESSNSAYANGMNEMNAERVAGAICLLKYILTET